MNVVVPQNDPPHYNVGSPADMKRMFLWCRTNQWEAILAEIKVKPYLATTTIMMDNHITTTILHQAITSKGNTEARAKVIRTILANTPQAARKKNGYGSLPLHVITQRNTKLDARTKESLVRELIHAHQPGLTEQGGTGRRTPVHIVFTDYVSLSLTRLMIASGNEACFIRDRKGWLPAHVACSRHVSPLKLKMLLRVNPNALTDRTAEGDNLMSLARKTATRSHPNYALIDEIQSQMNRRLHRNLPAAGAPIHHQRMVADLAARHRRMLEQARHRRLLGQAHPNPRPRLVAAVARPRLEDDGNGDNADAPTAETLLLLANHHNRNNNGGDGPTHAGGNDDGEDRPMEVVRV